MNPSLGSSQADVGCAPDEAWPLVQTFTTSDNPSDSTQRCSSCDEDEERDVQSSGLTPAEPEDGSNNLLLQPQLSATEGE